MAIMVGMMMLPFFVSSWIMIHLGIKPVNGGRPPSDSRVIRMVETSSGALFHIWDKERVVVFVYCINIMNIGIVNRM